MSRVSEVTPAAGERRSRLASELRRVLGPAGVLAEKEDLKPYECDGLSASRETPLVAAIPIDEDEVAAVLAVARRTRTPVVARGSGTGLSGGALPLADGILLSLARFNRVPRVDAAAPRARPQPGVTNPRLSPPPAPLGLHYR